VPRGSPREVGQLGAPTEPQLARWPRHKAVCVLLKARPSPPPPRLRNPGRFGTADRNSRRIMRWNLAVGLLAGAFLGPFAFLLFLVSGIVSKSEQRVPCPQCAETIKREAKICPRCQSQVASAHT
jgi:hypothetical protein